MSSQDQFLEVIDRDVAEARFRAALSLSPLGTELVPLHAALGRVLAEAIVSTVNVPGFDRSNYDGYAVRAADTFGASELVPRTLRLQDEILHAGTAPRGEVHAGEAMAIATGGMLPRGADAVVMIEHADTIDGKLHVHRAVSPGFGISFAGTDIATGEIVLRAGSVLTSRETGVLAALGTTTVPVWRKPCVGILSTGNEVIAPGSPLPPACIYDSNAQILADAVRELGGEPRCWGIICDDLPALRAAVHAALQESDMVLLSGGTSKGQGDLCYRIVAEFHDPGIVAHGVALKPGKPLCLAVTQGKPVVILPGFPTSAIFTFHEFVAPVLRLWAGHAERPRETVRARMALKTNSEIGRTEFLLVGLVPTDNGLAAFPMGKGSGSVTTFSRADGFVTIPRHTEIVDAGTEVDVQLLSKGLELADLVVIGSHCIGLDFLLGELQSRGVTTKLLTVGSSAGLAAVRRGECDIAGIHLLDAATGEYNRPFLTPDLELITGYGRAQGIAFRKGDERFENRTAAEIVATVSQNSTCVMVNRNQGSGTRILIDRLLQGAQPAGYAVQPSNHTAVAAAIVQRRADWGVTIASVAHASGLEFVPFQNEQYDFVIPRTRLARAAVQAFIALLRDPSIRQRLREKELTLGPEPTDFIP